ncbi:MAG TPA: UdgX family uracil-DNA binding protein [Solirubrobacteraceae bacterium]|jgi:DNA polymerase|nr:UdgX family uracil-DNA binding protein [Solirubrobacteraceae bacterium]
MSPRSSIASVRREAEACRACPLWRDATQTVFGEGPAHAALMLVGEQPGDREDRAGHPFVGPAGAMLDDALEQAGIERASVYATNAVKHFKHRSRGKRRIHQRPSAAEQAACRPWLERELELVEPVVAVALGATAAHALIGRATPIGESRGRPLEGALFSPVLVTAHPSSVLRERERDARHEALAAIVSDLRVALSLATENEPRSSSRA